MTLACPTSTAYYVPHSYHEGHLVAAIEQVLLRFPFYGATTKSITNCCVGGAPVGASNECHALSGIAICGWAPHRPPPGTAHHHSMSDKTSPAQNGLFERFIRTLKEEPVDYSEYVNFDDALSQIKHWLEVTYMREYIHQALDYLTPVAFQMAAWAKPRYPLLSPTVLFQKNRRTTISL